MKKKIIIGIFLPLILITAIVTVAGAIESYLYDMDPANGVDLLEGFAAAFIIIIGGFVILYETDLFYTVYYFFVKPKTITKSILNILSNLCLLLLPFSTFVAKLLSIREEWLMFFAQVLIYFILRFVYFIISVRPSLSITERTSL